MNGPPSAPTSPEASNPGWDAPVFVWGVWLALSVALLALIATWRNPYPTADDWAIVPYVTGEQPLTLGGLCIPQNEHWLPLVRLILAGTARLSGCDFRAPALLNALLLIGLTAVLIEGARRLRGRTEVSDAFLPMVLLHWGHQELFFVTFALNLLLATVLSTILLLTVLGSPGGPDCRRTVLVGACLLALPLSGASGLPAAVAVAGWLAWSALRLVRRADQAARKAAALQIGTAVAALVLVGLCLIAGGHPAGPSAGPGWRPWLRTSAQCLGISGLPWLAGLWPAWGVVVPLLLLGTGLALLRALWRQPEERLRAGGVLLFLGAQLGLALSIGHARSPLGPDAGLAPRYAVALLPGLLAAYLVWCFRPASPWGRLVQTGMFALACGGMVLRMNEGWEAARHHHDTVLAPLARDIHAGAPAEVVAESHSSTYPWPALLAQRLRALHGAGYPAYRSLGEQWPGLVETSPGTVPAEVHQMTRAEGGWTATGEDPFLVFRLEQPCHVKALRVRYRLTRPAGPQTPAQVFWTRHELGGFSATEGNRLCHWPAGAEWQTRTVWIDDTVRRLRLDPTTGPCLLELAELTLLVPQETALGHPAPARPR